MKSLVLEERLKLSLRDFPIEREEVLGARDVRIKLHTVGICGSDVHYYTHGGTGVFQVKAPMILGHEASGTVIETGPDVTGLTVGDRVCMEPGIPDPNSRATRLGLYNVDPAVRFWATPPIHGVLRPTVVHPADFTFKLPDNVSFAEAAMVEPLAVGVHAATKAQVKPGDIALVIGAGPIGLVTALSALAAGCARVFVSDIDDAKLEIAAKLGAIVPVNVQRQDLAAEILKATNGWGVEIVFECSGHPKGAEGVFDPLCPGGRVVFIGSQVHPVQYDVGKAMVREARVEHVFRYAHVFPRCVAMLSSGAIDVKPLITRNFSFDESVEAFEIAAAAPKGEVKMQILLPQ
ncbi:NAD(P)-dependent alcohol dehydrogenase [Shinella yambaruensis]|uniref:Alcohol dehydrogenase n=1 Tax=Shinella yambaruensis TaxID=415996 RepID=A0ABQ5ZDB0_9HYPH|nr:NAD(P)-dependent alcohol dehydrogenase [Shinella yambaruensis]MCJ8024234.1 NAD(P)-dependent alcohol dehydrogenase [Shinella yambaruensis]MCU7978617.1 NAD(P)-dependent alcohol dehydrogenase [Shinella yambaruensis]GLR49531.1 alcohol dehydrogenase [Shinella yambaruensis]